MSQTSLNAAPSDNAAVVRHLIVKVLLDNGKPNVVTPESISDQQTLGAGGLGVTSLLLLQVLVKLEESLNVTFEDAAVANAKFATVGELVGFVSESLQRRSMAPAEAR